MFEQYAGWLVAAHTEVAALGPSAFPGLADLHPVETVAALPGRQAVGTLSAGVALHDPYGLAVGVVLDGEKGLLHGYPKISFHRYERVPSLRTRLTMETASVSRRPQYRAPALRRRR